MKSKFKYNDVNIIGDVFNLLYKIGAINLYSRDKGHMKICVFMALESRYEGNTNN